MKVMLDTCIAASVRRGLEAFGHDVFWAGELPVDPGDEAIMARAYAEARVLITFDKDYGELAVVQKKPHSGIIRLIDMTARQQIQVCSQVLGIYGAELLSGAIVTADTHRTRLRRPSERNGQS